MNNNPYSILNISQDATYEEIKDSYLHLSRNLHPDKQPIQNYHMAKEHFETIDKAYKSIASPLRRFIFKEFGLKGIGLIDEFPLEFKHFEQDGLNIEDKEVQKKIRHLVVYMLHEEHAMNEMDKSKLATKSIINLTKLLKQNKYFSSARRVPEIQKNSFNYEMPLPDYYGFSNSFGIGNQTGLQKGTSSTLDFTFTTMKRVRNNILLNAQASVSNQATTFDFNADWIINNSMQVRCCPISLVNSDIQTPKIGVDKVFQDFSFSGITDFQHINIDISDLNSQRGGSKSKHSKSLKVMMEKNAIMMVPKYEYEMTKDLSLILQIMGSLQGENKQNITFSFGLNYGYRLKLSDEYKLQLLSFTGTQNYFQFSLYSPKFRVNIPFLSEGVAVNLESYKVMVFLLTYAAIKGYQWLETQNHMKRKKVIHQEYNRLSQEKLLINKAINEVSTIANDKLEKELKYNGLIVVKAFLGEFNKLQRIFKLLQKIEKQNKNTAMEAYEAFKTLLQHKLTEENIKYGDIDDELYEITDIFRSFIRGGQIINKKVQPFHPLLDEESVPYVLTVYLNRGEVGVYFEENEKVINIGGVMEKKGGYIKRVKSWVVDWLW